MNYTLHQLRIFAEVVRQRSVTEAAQVLHLSQPAVSVQLNKLENEFPLPLTERVGRSLQPTEFGLTMARLAEDLLRDAEALEAAASAHLGLTTGRLRIASVSTGKYVMPYLLTDFMHSHPGLQLLLEVTNRQQVVESLEDALVDLALVSVVPDHLPLEVLPIMANQLELVARPGLQPCTANPQEALNRLPLIFREVGSGTRKVMEAYLTSAGVEPARRMELTSNEAVKQAVLAGLGQSIMPLIGLRNELNLGQLEIIPCQGLPLQTEWSLVWRSDRKLPPAARALIQELEQNLDRVIERIKHP